MSWCEGWKRLYRKGKDTDIRSGILYKYFTFYQKTIIWKISFKFNRYILKINNYEIGGYI